MIGMKHRKRKPARPPKSQGAARARPQENEAVVSVPFMFSTPFAAGGGFNFLQDLTAEGRTYFRDLAQRWVVERAAGKGIRQCPQCRREFADWPAAQSHWKDCCPGFTLSLESWLWWVLEKPLPRKGRINSETEQIIRVESFRRRLTRESEKLQARTDLDPSEKQRRLAAIEQFGVTQERMVERFSFFGEVDKDERCERYRGVVFRYQVQIEEFYHTYVHSLEIFFIP
jgi:hypothetical protein